MLSLHIFTTRFQSLFGDQVHTRLSAKAVAVVMGPNTAVAESTRVSSEVEVDLVSDSTLRSAHCFFTIAVFGYWVIRTAGAHVAIVLSDTNATHAAYLAPPTHGDQQQSRHDNNSYINDIEKLG
jgi:hypothetical protein